MIDALIIWICRLFCPHRNTVWLDPPIDPLHPVGRDKWCNDCNQVIERERPA